MKRSLFNAGRFSFVLRHVVPSRSATVNILRLGLLAPIFFLLVTTPVRAAGWTSFPLSNGEMTSIAMDPADAKTVYVGTRNAGVYKTTNGGKSWQPSRKGLTFYPIRSLAIDPKKSTTIYAGTDYDGIWKSIDGGLSWVDSSSGLDTGLIVFNIVIDPTNTSKVYAGLAGGVGLGIGNIYKSQDGGASWHRRDKGIPHYSPPGSYTSAIFSLALNPEKSSTLYAGTHQRGVYQSIDSGETWKALNKGLPFDDNSTTNREAVNALATDPHHGQRLSALIGGNFYVFLSGSGWQKISEKNYYLSWIFPGHLSFHPTNPEVIYSAGDELNISTDAGKTWKESLGWGSAQTGSIVDLAFHPSAPDTLYAASAISTIGTELGGVFKSTDRGDHWTLSSKGITAEAVRSVAVDPQNPLNIYVGTGTGGIFRSENGGKSWARSYYPLSLHQDLYSLGSEVSGIAVDPVNPQIIYVAGNGVYKSTDWGKSFLKIDMDFYPHCISMSHNGSNPIYVGSTFDGVIRSFDGGATWKPINKGLPKIMDDLVKSILSLAVDPGNASIVWAGTQYGGGSGGIFRSSDAGENWEGKGLAEDNSVYSIAVSPTDNNTILAGAGFYSKGNIYKSTDGGETWVKKVKDIGFVYDIKFDSNNPNHVYAATEGSGVLRSKDGGETWKAFSTGIFYPVVYSLAINNSNSRRLLAGSYGSGLYWQPLPLPKSATSFPPDGSTEAEELFLSGDGLRENRASVFATSEKILNWVGSTKTDSESEKSLWGPRLAVQGSPGKEQF